MTPWHRNEYVLKGLFLGLWTFFALQVPASSAEAWKDILWVLGWTGLGVFVGLILGTGRLMARGLKPWENWKAFPFLVLLESPLFIYAGTLIGLTAGVLSGREFAQPWAVPIANAFGLTWDDIRHTPPVGDWLGYCAVGGAVLGLCLYQMRKMEDRQWRFFVGLAVAAAMVYLASEFVLEIKVPVMVADPANPGQTTPKMIPDPANAENLIPAMRRLFEDENARFNLGIYLLLGLPFFYLLTFSGEAEESEVEIMTLCGTLGVALHLTGFAKNLGGAAAFLLPMALYFVYATRLLPGLRVFKHVLRGYSYMHLGRLALALRFLRRARELNPHSQLANEGLLVLHNNITLSQLERDPDLVEALDFGLCLDRAQALLMQPPSQQARDEAEKFLALVEQKKPVYAARIDYLRAISLVHAKQYDAAAETLSRLLNPETPAYHTGLRRQVYFDALSLVLDGPKGLTDRLGWAELNKPGRRMEAIAAVERRLAADPGDAKAQEYRTVLYSQLTEGEFVAAAVHGEPKDFSYEFVEQLGYQLADDSDPERADRGMAFLRVAGRGLPDRVPTVFKKLADVAEKRGSATEARAYTEHIAAFGKKFGPANLAKDQRDIYLKALQRLAELAEAEGDVIKAEADAADARGDADARAAKDDQAKPLYEAAIEYLKDYLTAGGGAVLEAYRKIAELYGKMRDALNAVLNTEHALTYDSTDADLHQKRDSYYYSVTIERLDGVKDRVGRWFDVGYCVKKAMSVLNAPEADADLLDWAVHLTRLAKVLEPTSNRVRFVEARCLLRRGDRDAGLQVLEDVSESPVGSGDEEEAWYNTRRLLGQLYLDELSRPDLAVKAYLDYKKFHKSGADTLFQIAKCYEALGDLGGAVKFYKAVTVFEEHPRYWDAKEALRRLGKEE
jgi:tetratricopeptide (TPR) repeat protein